MKNLKSIARISSGYFFYLKQLKTILNPCDTLLNFVSSKKLFHFYIFFVCLWLHRNKNIYVCALFVIHDLERVAPQKSDAAEIRWHRKITRKIVLLIHELHTESVYSRRLFMIVRRPFLVERNKTKIRIWWKWKKKQMLASELRSKENCEDVLRVNGLFVSRKNASDVKRYPNLALTTL